jgi:hypothetical protein
MWGKLSDEDRKEEWQFEGLTKILKHDILFSKSKNDFHSIKNQSKRGLACFPNSGEERC